MRHAHQAIRNIQDPSLARSMEPVASRNPHIHIRPAQEQSTIGAMMADRFRSNARFRQLASALI